MEIVITEDNSTTLTRIGRLVKVAYPEAVVTQFMTLDESQAYASRQTVDCWLVDLGLPDGSGVQLIRHVRMRQPQCNVLVISVFEDPHDIIASLEAGANGYLHKNALEDDLKQAMKAMFNGGTPLSPAIASRLLQKMLPRNSSGGRENKVATSHEPQNHETTLSPKEVELLNLLSRGYSYSECAELLNVKIGTIQTHIKRVYSKLQVNSKTQAVFEAKILGVLQ